MATAPPEDVQPAAAVQVAAAPQPARSVEVSSMLTTSVADAFRLNETWKWPPKTAALSESPGLAAFGSVPSAYSSKFRSLSSSGSAKSPATAALVALFPKWNVFQFKLGSLRPNTDTAN